MKIARWYVRCPDCLTVSAVDGESVRSDLACSLCSVPVEVMGQVKADRLIGETLDSACDYRCTGARGPKCNCPCEGKNHGTHARRIVQFDCGPVPVITPAEPEKAIARATQWKALRDRVAAAIEATYGDIIRAKRAGEYLADRAFQLYLDAGRVKSSLHHAGAMKSHPARMKAAESIIVSVTGEEAK